MIKVEVRSWKGRPSASTPVTASGTACTILVLRRFFSSGCIVTAVSGPFTRFLWAIFLPSFRPYFPLISGNFGAQLYANSNKLTISFSKIHLISYTSPSANSRPLLRPRSGPPESRLVLGKRRGDCLRSYVPKTAESTHLRTDSFQFATSRAEAG